jgi:hypothetical protein
MRFRFFRATRSRFNLVFSLGVAAAAAVVFALQPAAGRATGLFRENLPSTLTAVSIGGSPPAYGAVDFFGIAPLEIPDPDADPALSNWGYRYRAVAVGNITNWYGDRGVQLAVWNSSVQVWRKLGYTSIQGFPGSFLQLWVNTKCPRMYVASVNSGLNYESIDVNGKCSDADPSASDNNVNSARSMFGLPFGTSLGSVGGAPFGSEVGNPTVFGGNFSGGAGGPVGLYKLDNLQAQPLWSLVCSPSFGAITRIAVGNYDPVSDTYTAIALDGSNRILRYQSGACSVITVDADATVRLNDVAFVGSTATAIAVGNGGRRYVSTRAGASGFWSRINEGAGQAYTDLGYPGSPPDLVGVSAFASGPVGRSAILFGNRSTGSANNVTPVYRVDDVARSGALSGISTDLFANFAGWGGLDPETFWAVRNGTIVRSFPGSASGYGWFGPDATTGNDPNGFFLRLSCGTQASCDAVGLNNGLNVESSSSVQQSAVIGRAWVGLTDGSAGVLSGGIRPNLQEHTELTPGVLGKRIGAANAAAANRLDRIAVAGNYLYTGGRFNDGGVPQRIERRQIASTGDAAGTLALNSGDAPTFNSSRSTCPGGTYDAGDNGYFQFGTPTVSGTDYLQVISPVAAENLRIRTVRADDAAYCANLKTPAPASVSTPATPGCIRNASAANYGVTDYTNTLYIVGGTCGGANSSSIYRFTVAANGTPDDGVANATTLWRTMLYPQVFVTQSSAGAVMVVYDPTSHELGVAPVNAAVDERCSGPVGTVCSFTVQTNAVPAGLYNGVAAYPTAVGVVGDYVLATYRSTVFNETPSAPDPRAAFRGRTVLAARIRPELPPGREVTTWLPAQDSKPTNFPPPAIAAWSSGARATAYFGTILDDRGWWSVQRYDTELFATSPGWLSFEYADSRDYGTGVLRLPPSSCIPYGSVTHPGLSRVIQTKTPYTVSGCASLLYPDEVWGWARLLNLKAEGERQNPRETDWGWVRLRGPAVSVPSSATIQSQFLCYDCDALTNSCAFCQSNSPKLTSNTQPTCSQCTGCDVVTGICGASGGTCAACYQYGVNLDRSPGGTFHGYAWSGGGRSFVGGIATGRIAVMTEIVTSGWLKTLVQNNPTLNGKATYYSHSQFASFLTAHASSPFQLVVLDDPHLTAAELTQFENSVVAPGAVVYATEEVRDTSGADRYAFAGAVICQGDSGGCEFTGSGTGATVTAADHSPLGIKAGDQVEDPPVTSYPGVLASSIGNGGTVDPVVDAAYTKTSTFGTIAELAHWKYGTGTVYYFGDTAAGANPADCSTVACLNFGSGFDFAATGTYHVQAMEALASPPATGYGWISFEQGATGATKFATFVQAQYGSIYAGGKITSTRGGTPFAEFGLCNAFLVHSASDVVTSLCADIAGKQLFGPNPQTNSSGGTFNPGLVTNATPIPFPKTENQFTSTVGPLDIAGLKAVTKTVDGVKYNKYGNVVEILKPQDFLNTFDGAGAVLGGKIYDILDAMNLQEDLTVNTPLVFKAGSGTTSGAGLIIVNGSLRFSANVTYESVNLDKLSHLASAGWIVNTGRGGPPDLTVDASVRDIAGTFFVRGMFRSLTGGASDLQLLVHGPALASQFDLQRNAVGTPVSLWSGQYIGGAVGSEVFIDDGRLRLNPPPGFQNLRAALPLFR